MIRGLLLYLIVKIFPALSMVVYMITMYMSFPARDYVAYSASIAAGVIGAQLASSWIASSIIFHFPLLKEKRVFILQVIRIAIVSILFVSVVTFVVFFVIFQDLLLGISVFFLTTCQGFFYILVALFQPERRMRPQVVSAFMLSIVQLFFAGYVFFSNAASLSISVAGYSAGFFIGLVTLVLYVYRTWFSGIGWKLSRHSRIEGKSFERLGFLAYGGPMFLWFSLMLISSYTDRFFLSQMEGAGVAGYAFTKDIMIGVSGFISMPIMLIAHSLIFRLFRENKKQELRQLIMFSTTLLSILFIFAIFIFVSFLKVQLTYFSPDLEYVSFFRAVLVGGGILFSTLALYSQKKFEVLGLLKQLVVLAAISNVTAFFAYMYSASNHSLDYFAISYAACALLYFCMTLVFGSDAVRFEINYRMVIFVLVVLVMMHFLAPPVIFDGVLAWGALGWAVAWLVVLTLVLISCLFKLYKSLKPALAKF